jgi:hypothetical protein
MAIVSEAPGGSRKLPWWLAGVVGLGLLLLLAAAPAIRPIILVWGDLVYSVNLERWEPPRGHEKLYPDPTLRLGPWCYRLRYRPWTGTR